MRSLLKLSALVVAMVAAFAVAEYHFSAGYSCPYCDRAGSFGRMSIIGEHPESSSYLLECESCSTRKLFAKSSLDSPLNP